MNVAQPAPLVHAPASAIPRHYNFAADILKRNLDAGRAGKLPFIDQTQGWTYGALADRVERFGHGLRALGLRREERVLLCLLDTIDWPTAFLGAIKAGVVADVECACGDGSGGERSDERAEYVNHGCGCSEVVQN